MAIAIKDLLNTQLSGTSGIVVLIAAVLGGGSFVTNTQGFISPPSVEVSKNISIHAEMITGSHPTIEKRLSKVELSQAVMANDVGHIKRALDDSKIATRANQSLLLEILKEVRRN